VLTILLATTLHFTAPQFNALASSCTESSSDTLHDLETVILKGYRQGDLSLWVLAMKPIISGRPDSLRFYDWGKTWRVFVTFVDTAGNESCPSNVVTVNGTTDVPLVETVRDWRVYDLQGRLVREWRDVTFDQVLAQAYALRRGIYVLRSRDGRITTRMLGLR